MPPDETTTALHAICDVYPESWTLSSCGLTPDQQPIPVLLNRRAYTHNTNATRILVISGLSGKESDSALADHLLQHIFEESKKQDCLYLANLLKRYKPIHMAAIYVPNI